MLRSVLRNFVNRTQIGFLPLVSSRSYANPIGVAMSYLRLPDNGDFERYSPCFTIGKWKAKVGDEITPDLELAEIEASTRT